MSTKFFLTDDAWVNLGSLPVTFVNNTPHLIKYIVSATVPGSLNDASQNLYSGQVDVTGTGSQSLFARLASATAGAYVTKDDTRLVAERVEFVITPTGLTLEDVVQAFKDALSDVSSLDIVDPIPTFGTANSSATAPYIGIRAFRGGNNAYFVFNESNDRWGGYLSTNDLGTKTLMDMEANTFYGSLAGNALTASKLVTARTISVTGAATGSTSFDGNANASIGLTLANSGVAPGNYSKVTISDKGLVTAGLSMVAADITTALGYTPYQATDADVAATANKLVLRNASGGFQAGIIGATMFVGPLTGNADTATQFANPVLINGKSFDGSTAINLKTVDVAEDTNLYFTNTRARNAVSASGNLSYNSGTGVFTTNTGIYRLPVLTKTADYNVVIGDLGALIICDASTDITLNLLGVAAAGAGFTVLIKNASTTSTVTLEPNSTETIDAVSSIVIPIGGAKRIVCTGSVWYSFAD